LTFSLQETYDIIVTSDIMNELCIIILLFFTYAFLGWCLEVCCKLMEKKKFINRGFLIGPYCPIYGYGAIFMTGILTKYLNDPVTLFIMIILSCSILEYFTSYILEIIFHTRWWDYSKNKFNINGRICLETMIPFGIFGLLIMYVINPFFYSIFLKIPNTLLYIISTLLIIIYIIDNIVSFLIIKEIQGISEITQRKQIIKKDDTERITKLVRKQIEESKKTFEKRIIHAFPNLKLKKIDFKKIKDRYKRKK